MWCTRQGALFTFRFVLAHVINASCITGSGYSISTLTSIARNVTDRQGIIGESTQVSSGHLLYRRPEWSLRSLVPPNSNPQHASHHLCTLHALEEPCEANLSTTVCRLACASLVHLRSTWCAFVFGIRISAFPLVSFYWDHLLNIQGFALQIMQCAESCWASLSSVQMASIKLMMAEYSAFVLCFYITVITFGSSHPPQNSPIIC